MSPVDEYLQNLTASERQSLNRIREIVRKAVPDAEESISYGLPAFKYKNKYLIGYGAHKNFMSIYPTSAPIAALKDKLTDYNTTKGAIQFTLDKPLNTALINDILAIRLASIK